ncbi:hypothetical protein CW304_18900 [Bacillus sp. UFRGS-B20]|nr:hypothetical protein CW304_18900 [Bacillus sp. UFRGS-B20]
MQPETDISTSEAPSWVYSCQIYGLRKRLKKEESVLEESGLCIPMNVRMENRDLFKTFAMINLYKQRMIAVILDSRDQ